MHTSSRLLLDIPDGTDQVSGYPAEAAQSLGVLDSAAMYLEGSLASRPGTPAISSGQVYRAVDTGQLFVSSGGSWFEFERVASKGQAGGYPGLQSGISSAVVAGQLGRVGYATDTNIWSLDNGSTLLPVGLTPAVSAVSATVLSGRLLVMGGASTTATLPSSVPVGTLAGVVAGNAIIGSGPVTVASAAGMTWSGYPGTAQTSLTLGTAGAQAVFVWNGTHWNCVGGGEDTGWVALTLGANVGVGDAYTPSCRRVNGTVRFKGTLSVAVAAGNATLATVPSGFRPPAPVVLDTAVYIAPNNVFQMYVQSSGVISVPTNIPSGLPGGIVPLNGCGYELAA